MSVAEEIKQELHPGKLFINGRWEDAERGGVIELLTTVPAAKAQFIGKLHGSQMDLKIEAKPKRGHPQPFAEDRMGI